jgi:hypothetical protein
MPDPLHGVKLVRIAIRSVILAIVMTATSALAADVERAGVLVWTDDVQTFRPCESDEVLWVRVLASNPQHTLSVRVRELSRTGGPLLAHLKGEVSPPVSAGPGYPVTGVIRVHENISLSKGSCPAKPSQ